MLTYTPDGQVATLEAVNASTGNQVTTYVYGTTLTDSAVAASVLLRSVIYPDSTGGSDQVWLGYNRQAQRTSLTDQNGSVHQYDYDLLGRLTQDRVPTLAAGVDGAVRRTRAASEVEHNVVEVDRLRAGDRGRSGVAAGQAQQVVDELLESHGLLQDAAMGREEIGVAGMGEIDLELRPDAGEGAAQLVRCVGDESLLTPCRLVEAFEHVVHGSGQTRDLVTRG